LLTLRRHGLSVAVTVLHYCKDGALPGPDKEHAETSMLALPESCPMRTGVG